ncbi:extracellular catalytic domain type 1 short-chain-length polyhydroxyalkanoate depolymerase [Methylobacterium oryzihabitans]|uniref:PHB depolymerase family esterase n=1 Tax=Methylobacterium oryzihabitans TaxID=2499852 RepID=A0A437NYF7_9HYPH|nr:PHB depolymerase family esterase [Methylobacterium oryzihabitans]RVU15049.1 PHB depolymerase family esterase [Methylobacterium oryzihabitans]
MRSKLLPGVIEATRLTGAGRLGEAVAVIQRNLRGEAAAEPAGQAGVLEPPTLDLVAERVAEPGPRPEPQPAAGEAPRERGAAEMPSGFPSGLPAGGFPLGGLPTGGLPAGGLSGLPEGLRDLAQRFGRPLGPLLDGLTPGSSPAPDLGMEERSFAGTAGQRGYKLYVPGGYRGQPVPLVVMLHGCTQNPDDFAAGTGMNRIAEAETFLVAYPAQTAAANHARCWNWFNTADQGRDRGEAAIVAGLTRAVMAEFAIDPRRVYVAGLSAGGAAAANLGAAYPDLYAAVGVHSGLCAGAAHDLPSAMMAMRQGAAAAPQGGALAPTIVFHGARDTTVHPRNGAQVIAAAAVVELRREAGQVSGGHSWQRTIYRDAQGRPDFEHWVIEGSGHAWSGGDPAGSYTDPHGPDASREMWRFFAEHPMPQG